MNNTTKLILLTFSNFSLVSAMLYLLASAGIDITEATLMDNAVNLSFTFYYVAFLVLSFLVNIIILSWQSKKNSTLLNALDIIQNIKQAKPKQSKHRKQIA